MPDAFEQFMESLAGSGWSDLEISKEKFAQQAQEQGSAERAEMNRQAAIVARALDTEAGRALLDLLMRKTVLRAPGDEERAARTAEAFAILKAKREGENSVVFMLLSMLQHHHGQPQTTQGGDQL
ncbi:MAG: hypothetical protein ACRCS9_08795 [Hyphomicrobium sp.]